MPFQKGNQAWRARGSKRKTKIEVQAEQNATEVFKKKLEQHAARLGDHYIKRAFKNDKVLINYADKVWDHTDKPELTVNIKNVQEFNWNEYQTLCVTGGSPRTIEAAPGANGTDESLHSSLSDSQASLISKFTSS